MIRFLKTLFSVLVYLLGGIVFVFVGYHVLHLIGFLPRTSLVASLPVGIIAFIIFIWWNWDEDFKSWYDPDHQMGNEELKFVPALLILLILGICFSAWFFLPLLLK